MLRDADRTSCHQTGQTTGNLPVPRGQFEGNLVGARYPADALAIKLEVGDITPGNMTERLELTRGKAFPVELQPAALEQRR